MKQSALIFLTPVMAFVLVFGCSSPQTNYSAERNTAAGKSKRTAQKESVTSSDSSATVAAGRAQTLAAMDARLSP
ncbi:MAG: hypothetical protein RL189_1328 [Pseudomonadota bacterium]